MFNFIGHAVLLLHAKYFVREQSGKVMCISKNSLRPGMLARMKEGHTGTRTEEHVNNMRCSLGNITATLNKAL